MASVPLFVVIGFNLSGSKEKTMAPTTDVAKDGLMRMLTWYTRPTVPVKYSNGYWGYVDGTSISQSVFKNPVEKLYQGNKDDNSYHFDGQAFGEIDIVKGLKFRSSIAYKYYMNDVSTFNTSQFLLRYHPDSCMKIPMIMETSRMMIGE